MQIAARGCSSDEALAELIGVADRHHVGVLARARALVGLASPDAMQQNDDAAVNAAISAFDHLLPVRRRSPVGPAQLPAY